MATFQQNLPESFREKLSSIVVTMGEGKKKKISDDKESFNADLIFSCVLYLLDIDQLNFSTLVNYELAPVPTPFLRTLESHDLYPQKLS